MRLAIAARCPTENERAMDYTKISRLDGKVALVTGGARGLGAEIAEALLQMGT